MKYRFAALFLSLMMLTSIAHPAAAQVTAGNQTAGCVTAYDPASDYFPEKVTVEAAAGFTVEYHNHYKVVTVNTPWQGSDAPLVYVLVQCGTPVPDITGAAAVLDVPVANVVSLSTSFLPHLTTQKLLDKVIAIDTALYTSNETIIQGAADGSIVEVGGGGGGTEIDVEKLIDLDPALILSQRFSADDTVYPAMQQAGLPVVLDADFLDTTPLGVAEWGKFISLFFNTEAAAQAAFAGISARYQAIMALAANADSQPTVLANTPFSGTWYMPGGSSYAATLIRDAGGAYLWGDDETTGSLMLSLEEVLDKAADADYWVNIYQNTTTDLLALDDRLDEFAAFQNGHIYTNNARLNANYGSDYYENGYANPDVLLSDLVKIFHPELLPEHTLYFYAPLAK